MSLLMYYECTTKYIIPITSIYTIPLILKYQISQAVSEIRKSEYKFTSHRITGAPIYALILLAKNGRGQQTKMYIGFLFLHTSITGIRIAMESFNAVVVV
jgi:hypothetical protein